MRVDVFLAGLLFLIVGGWPAAAEAQRNCTKGKPCGNSCISRDKVCRLNGGQAIPLSRPAPAPGPSMPWVGYTETQMYYWSECPAAKKIPPKRRLSFSSESEAQAIGYRASPALGCRGPNAISDSAWAELARGPWTAWLKEQFYYRVDSTCAPLKSISEAERVYFDSEAGAQAAGYIRSSMVGC